MRYIKKLKLSSNIVLSNKTSLQKVKRVNVKENLEALKLDEPSKKGNKNSDLQINTPPKKMTKESNIQLELESKKNINQVKDLIDNGLPERNQKSEESLNFGGGIKRR